MVSQRPHVQSLSWGDVIGAYTVGLFPMADPDNGSISWYAPDPRGIIELGLCKPTRSLRRTIRSGVFEVRWNTAFRAVVAQCAEREETWISPEIREAYVTLHEKGLAHSVECWTGGHLAGGLYGVSLRGAFFGESMFTRRTDASKVALIALVDRMKERGFVLLDAQFMTPHLERFGGRNVPRTEYLARLNEALSLRCSIYP